MANTRDRGKPTTTVTVPSERQDTGGIDLNNRNILNPTFTDDPPQSVTTIPAPVNVEVTDTLTDMSGNVINNIGDPITTRRDWNRFNGVTSQKRYQIPGLVFKRMGLGGVRGFGFQKHKWSGSQNWESVTCTPGADADSRNGFNSLVERSGGSRNQGDWGCSINLSAQMGNWLVNFSSSWLFNAGQYNNRIGGLKVGDSVLTNAFLGFTYNPYMSAAERAEKAAEARGRYFMQNNGKMPPPYNPDDFPSWFLWKMR